MFDPRVLEVVVVGFLNDLEALEGELLEGRADLEEDGEAVAGHVHVLEGDAHQGRSAR